MDAGLYFYWLQAYYKRQGAFKKGENYIVASNQFVYGCAAHHAFYTRPNKTIAKSELKGTVVWFDLPAGICW